MNVQTDASYGLSSNILYVKVNYFTHFFLFFSEYSNYLNSLKMHPVI